MSIIANHHEWLDYEQIEKNSIEQFKVDLWEPKVSINFKNWLRKFWLWGRRDLKNCKISAYKFDRNSLGISLRR